MNLFKLVATLGLDTSEYEEKSKGAVESGKGLGSKLGSAMGAAAKVVVTGVSAAAGAVATLTTFAVKNFAEYEQLVGGVETLFKDSAGKVQEFADMAYQTAGLSANQYMETVTGFSASLLQSLGGDTEAAANYADMAVRDMSDNANKMGTSMEMIQNAYQGFAKQNFEMLDNLKLGYGGTKEEMQRLLRDAEKLSGIKYDISSYSDIIDAIHVVQDEMGITGTTAKEASETISGSVASMKSAWSNWVTSLGKDNANLKQTTDQLFNSVVTVGKNVLPVVQTVLKNVSTAVTELAPQLMDSFVNLIAENVPVVIDSAVSLVVSLVEGIGNNLPLLLEAGKNILFSILSGIFQVIPQIAIVAAQIVGSAAQYITDNFPQIVQTGTKFLSSMVDGIITGIQDMLKRLPQVIESFLTFVSDSLPQVVESGTGLLVQFTDGIINTIPTMLESLPQVINSFVGFIASSLPTILNQGVEILLSVINGIINTIPQLVARIPEIIQSFVKTIAENLPKIIKAGIDIMLKLVFGILEAIPQLVASVPQLIGAFIDGIVGSFPDILQVGKDIVSSIIDGIASAWDGLVSWFNGLWDGLFGGRSVDVNVNETSSGSGKAHAGGLDYVPYNSYPAELHRGEAVLTARQADEWRRGKKSGGVVFSGLTINISGANYSDEEELADAIATRLQSMAERTDMVYA